MNVVVPDNPHFARIGGRAVVERLVEAFYERMSALPEAAAIRAMHAEDLTDIKALFVMYLTEWLGAPGEYSARHGHPRLRQRHARFRIGPAERDAWMACMLGALDEVVPDVLLREQLGKAFLRTAEAIVSTAG
jgi:hemoglobin